MWFSDYVWKKELFKMGRKILTSGLALACVAVLLLPAKAGANETSFDSLLEDYQICVEGQTEALSFGAIEGLLMEVDTKYSEVWKKYKEILSRQESVALSPKDILELHYYSLTDMEQKAFLARARNQKVNIDISQKEAILISYNPNF